MHVLEYGYRPISARQLGIHFNLSLTSVPQRLLIDQIRERNIIAAGGKPLDNLFYYTFKLCVVNSMGKLKGKLTCQ